MIRLLLELKSIPEPNSGCMIWLGERNQGYGRIFYEGRKQFAHRLAFILNKGPIPDGKIVMHTCDNKLCINPDHLTIGTHVENIQDMDRKGRRNLKFQSRLRRGVRSLSKKTNMRYFPG